jgi:hypothetical protein
MKAYATLWEKRYPRSSGHTFDQANRVLVSRVATDLVIHDRVSMKTGRLSQVPTVEFNTARAIRFCAPLTGTMLCRCHKRQSHKHR